MFYRFQSRHCDSRNSYVQCRKLSNSIILTYLNLLLIFVCAYNVYLKIHLYGHDWPCYLLLCHIYRKSKKSSQKLDLYKLKILLIEDYRFYIYILGGVKCNVSAMCDSHRGMQRILKLERAWD